MTNRIIQLFEKILILPLLSFALLSLSPDVARAAEPDAVNPAVACDSLQSVDLTAIGGAGSRVISAKPVTANHNQWCQVGGILAPEIGFRVLLPMESWNQRYM